MEEFIYSTVVVRIQLQVLMVDVLTDNRQKMEKIFKTATFFQYHKNQLVALIYIFFNYKDSLRLRNPKNNNTEPKYHHKIKTFSCLLLSTHTPLRSQTVKTKRHLEQTPPCVVISAGSTKKERVTRSTGPSSHRTISLRRLSIVSQTTSLMPEMVAL